MFDICPIIKSIDKDSSDFNFITRSSAINEIIEDVDLLLSWNSARWYRAWSLLDGPLLIIPVDALGLLCFVLLTLANYTGSEELFYISLSGFVVMIWPFDVLAAKTSVVSSLFFRKDACSLGYDSSNLDEGVELHLP